MAELRKEHGKIEKVSFGLGGYQEAQVGLWMTITGKGWGVGHGICGGWSFPPDAHAKWTLEDQTESYAKMMRDVLAILKDAKVDSVHQLQGIPVEVEFEGMMLKNFRIFTEVL